MRSLLSLAYWIWVVVVTLSTLLPIHLGYLLFWPFGRQQQVAHFVAKIWGRLLVVAHPFCRLRLEGRENLLPCQAVVYTANHQSLTDIAALFSLPGQYRWVTKESIMRIPLLGHMMRMCGYIPLERGKIRDAKKFLELAAIAIQKKVSVVMFPEGTRSPDGVLRPFKNGAFRLASEQQVPIVPIAISGTHHLLPKGDWRFQERGTVYLTILPPILPADKSAEQLKEQTYRVIQTQLAQQSLLPLQSEN